MYEFESHYPHQISMNESKPWWQSRTIWSGIIGGVFSILTISGVTLPVGFSTEIVLGTVMSVSSLAAIIFRVKATKEINATTTISN